MMTYHKLFHIIKFLVNSGDIVKFIQKTDFHRQLLPTERHNQIANYFMNDKG